jgi:metal-sulfur cluster biosynthetic enzyme
MIQKIYEIMKEIYDPEIPLDIVNLGLIKNININNGEINIVMTLTSPDCPLANVIITNIRNKLLQELEDVEKVNIHLDFTKSWTTDEISPDGREKLRKLGWNV